MFHNNVNNEIPINLVDPSRLANWIIKIQFFNEITRQKMDVKTCTPRETRRDRVNGTYPSSCISATKFEERGVQFKRLETVLRNYRLDTPGVTSFSLSSLQPGNPPLINVIAFLGPGHLRQAMVNRLRRRQRQVRTTFSATLVPQRKRYIYLIGG